MKVNIIGIGAGNPDHLSIQAINAIGEVDVFLVADKGEIKSDLVQARRTLVEKYHHGNYRFLAVTDPKRGPDAQRDTMAYTKGVDHWHEARAHNYAAILADLPAETVVGFLVWGDPAFYDSTIRIVDRIKTILPIQVSVIPGITAFQALAAAHGIVLHEVGGPVHITTGRRLVKEWHPDLGMTVVMLDGHLRVQELSAIAPETTIYWGAYLGLANQTLISGRLAEVIDQIITERARLRAEHGWLMDVYAIAPPASK